MKITVGFSYHLGFAPISSLIRWYLGRSFSHTYIKLQLSELEEPSVFHAVGKGVSILSYSNFLKMNVAVKEFELEISEELYLGICNEFHDFAGTSYGALQNLGIILYDKGIVKKNPFSTGINCSEWVAYCLEEVFPKDWDSHSRDFNSIKPSEIYDYLDNNI